MTLADIACKNIRLQRRRRKLTQEQLAAKADISVAYVSLLERGQRAPPLDTLEHLARALRVEPLELLARRQR